MRLTNQPTYPPAKNDFGFFKVIEVLHAEELQKLLRTVGPNLGDCLVKTKSELEPWVVEVCGALQIHGEPHFWTVNVDMREIKSAEDILEMAGAIEASFEKAASKVASGANS